jgi:hypothetical protein
MDVASPQGPRPVMFDKDTSLEDAEGNILPMQGLHQKMVVAIYGIFSEDGRTLTATRIVILPSAQDQPQP